MSDTPIFDAMSRETPLERAHGMASALWSMRSPRTYRLPRVETPIFEEMVYDFGDPTRGRLTPLGAALLRAGRGLRQMARALSMYEPPEEG